MKVELSTPFAEPVPWIGTSLEGTVTVTARTWIAARELAMVLLGVGQGQIVVRTYSVVSEEKKKESKR